MLFGGAPPSAGAPLMAGTLPAPHVFTHGADLAAPREYLITMLQLPVHVGELEVEAEQTHEIYWEPETGTAFVSIVTSSRLLQLV